MKPAHRTVSYVVYPPRYTPGDGGYVRVANLKEALRQCRRSGFGPGATVHRNFSTSNRRVAWTYGDTRGPFIYGGEQ